MSSSELSSPPSTPSIDFDDNSYSKPTRGNIESYFKPDANRSESLSPKRKRPASPPHDYVLADNADIAFIVMFRSRFSSAFPKNLPHYGPQDIEKGVQDVLPDEHVERLLCALIGLVLNRKKDVERGHFQRALEEAVQSHASQWPRGWNHKNPLHGGVTFNTMAPSQRLSLLKALTIWSLGSSEAIQALLKESYKQQRHDDDLNQPLSVQFWGEDGEKRRYWLVEGRDDTHFRLYRESRRALGKNAVLNNTWYSVAGDIDELKTFQERLEDDPKPAAKKLCTRIKLAIPRFEASEEKRKRRDYRYARSKQFTRPEPGVSLYEGRTRGKRIRYTFSDEEDGYYISSKHPNRPSGISTPAEAPGPTFTASGREVKSRIGGSYGETRPSRRKEGDTSLNGSNGNVGAWHITASGDDEASATQTRSRRSGRKTETNDRWRQRSHIEGYNSLDEMNEESDAVSSGGWDGGEEDDDAEANGNEDDGEDEDDENMDVSETSADSEEDYPSVNRSLIVCLKYRNSRESYHGPTNGDIQPLPNGIEPTLMALPLTA